MKRKRHVLLVTAGVFAVAMGVPVTLTWREWRQAQLNQQLIAAIKRNDTQAVVAALRQGANANARDRLGASPSFLSVAQRLLRHQPFPTEQGTPALALTFDMGGNGTGARLNANPQIIRALLDAGADVNTRQCLDVTAQERCTLGRLFSRRRVVTTMPCLKWRCGTARIRTPANGGTAAVIRC